jgi:gamma-glutamyl:cysteine ligase YbdK (ATP-grasp superfamily)
MPLLPFKKSSFGTIGVEVELQIIDNKTHQLASLSPQILEKFHKISHLTIEVNQFKQH